MPLLPDQPVQPPGDQAAIVSTQPEDVAVMLRRARARMERLLLHSGVDPRSLPGGTVLPPHELRAAIIDPSYPPDS